MDEPDYSLSVTYRLPREGVWVQVWFAGHDERWAYAKRSGDTWLVDSRELPSDVPVGSAMITRWQPAPPDPQEIDRSDFLESAADVILEAVPVKPKRVGKQGRLPR